MLSLEYIAGLFDGEGHVSITATKRRSGTDPKLTVRLTNTFLPIIREIQHMYGGHIYKARKVKEHYLQVYVLSLTVEESKKFLSDILPFLHIKRDQATYLEWGEVNGKGKNMLGLLLMEVRTSLKKNR